MNDLLLRALRCEEVERPPIWLMRQAGRYMPEYRALRSKYSFRELVGTPELAAEITRLPLELGVDAAILFSDILVLSEVFGYRIEFSDGKGIRIVPPEHDIKKEVGETLSYVPSAIRLLKKDLAVPLIGFCGGPYTVAKYMNRITSDWLEKITQATIEYLQLQVDAGVDVIQIFDSWAGHLSPADFQTLSLPYLKTIVETVKVPVVVFCRGSCHFINELVSLKPSAIGFDWDKEMIDLRKEVPENICIQGNLDPEILKGPLDILQQKARALLDSMKGTKGYIFNLGHGVLPETPVQNVQWLVNYVKTPSLSSV